MLDLPTSANATGFDWQPPAEALVPRAAQPRLVERKRWRRSWRLSAWLHVCVAATVMLELMLAMSFAVPVAGGPRQVEIVAVLERDENEQAPLAELPIQIHDDATAERIADEQIARIAAHAVSPELEQQLLAASDPAGESVAAAWVQQRVASEIAAAERGSHDDQLRRLEQLTGTLNRVSSAESVDAIAGRLQTLLGTENRAQEPSATPVAGEFDLDSAQLHDVKRADDGQGGFSYVAIMLDAQGRTLETPLDAAEGERLFGIFELIKSNPLLERVYRGVVLSLLDKLMKAPPSGTNSPPAP